MLNVFSTFYSLHRYWVLKATVKMWPLFALLLSILFEYAQQDQMHMRHNMQPSYRPSIGWQQWSGWSACSVTCGEGQRQRSRQSYCTRPVMGRKRRYGFPDCSRRCSQTKKCYVACKTDGHWSSWSNWDSCSVTCGRGFQKRFRSCVTVTNQGAASSAMCPGDSFCVKHCDIQCPVVWGPWSPWSGCDATCGHGYNFRESTCLSGNCPSQTKEDFSMCYIADCQSSGWQDWSSWSSCDRTCGIGHHFRTRQCSVASSATWSCPHQESKETSMCAVAQCPSQIAFTTTGSTTTVAMTTSTTIKTATRPTKATKITMPTTTTVCVDIYQDCKSLGKSICSGGTQSMLAFQVCRAFCGFCGQSPTQTTAVTTIRSTQTSTTMSRAPAVSSPGPCADTYSNCANLGKAVCGGQNAVWAKQYCRKYCVICT